MVEQYLERNIEEDTGWQPEKGSWVDQLLGSARLPAEYKHLDDKEIKEKEIRNKYDS